MSFFEELKRRNVYRVGLAYGVLGWVVIEVTDTVGPALNLPDWTLTIVTWFGIIGFPFALVFAWAFELTPEGLKRDHEVDRSQSIMHHTGRKLDFAIIGMLVMALGYFAYDKFVLSVERDAARFEATTHGMTEQAETEPEGPKESDNSIAVLLFVNVSDDESNEYFSYGLSEELLNLLAKIPELRVAARTSAFSFKGKDLQISEIGNILNVAHVLEGSVRKAGDQVRITAQLIKVDDGYHLWSETYDRTLDNIFAIQDEIAAEVVAQLKVRLLGAAPTVQETDPAAYTLFLQARHLGNQGTPEAWEHSIALYQQALEIDSGYAAAWTGLAYAYLWESEFLVRPYEESVALMRESARQALVIDPDYASAHAILGFIAIFNDGDVVAAAKHYERALALGPANSDALFGASMFAQILGRVDVVIKIREFLVARDPASSKAHQFLGMAYQSSGRHDEAIDSFRTALRLSPGAAVLNVDIGRALLQKGEFEAALTAIQAEPFEGYRLIGLALAYHALGQVTESDAALAWLIENAAQEAVQEIAWVLATRGEADRAFEWLNKAVQYNQPALRLSAVIPELASLHDDPRWLPFLERIGIAPEQVSAIEFNVTLPE